MPKHKYFRHLRHVQNDHEYSLWHSDMVYECHKNIYDVSINCMIDPYIYFTTNYSEILEIIETVLSLTKLYSTLISTLLNKSYKVLDKFGIVWMWSQPVSTESQQVTHPVSTQSRSVFAGLRRCIDLVETFTISLDMSESAHQFEIYWTYKIPGYFGSFVHCCHIKNTNR